MGSTDAESPIVAVVGFYSVNGGHGWSGGSDCFPAIIIACSRGGNNGENRRLPFGLPNSYSVASEVWANTPGC